MATTDVKIPRELLISFDDDGVPVGAAYSERRVVTIDGEVVSDTVMQYPVKLGDDDPETGRPDLVVLMEDVVGKALAQALVAVEAVKEEKYELKRMLEAAEEERAHALVAADIAAGEAEKANAAIKEMQVKAAPKSRGAKK